MHDYRLPCVSLGLIIYLQTSFSRTCDLDFKDVPSKTYQADFVFEATVHRLVSSGGGGKGSKDKSIVRFNVSDIFKGTLDKEANGDRYQTISVGKFGVKADPGRCIAPLPQLGSRYVLFLRSAETDSGIRTLAKGEGNSLLPDFVLSSFPEPLSDDVISSVRRSTDSKFAAPVTTTEKPHSELCTSNGYCLHGGTCYYMPDLKREYCHCPAAFTGKRCKTKYTGLGAGLVSGGAEKPFSKPCKSDCLNGGTCYYMTALKREHCQCTADFTGKRCATKDTGLPVSGKALKPGVRMPTKNLTFAPGKETRVQCIVSGQPRPKVNWFKDNEQLQSSKRISFQDTKRGSTLVIRRFSLTDSGIYRCQAVNVVGSTSLNSTKGVFLLIAVSTTAAPVTTTVTAPVTTTEEPCKSDGYCLNGGTCYYIPELRREYCLCPAPFTGKRCKTKDPGGDAFVVSAKEPSRKRRLLLIQPYAM